MAPVIKKGAGPVLLAALVCAFAAPERAAAQVSALASPRASLSTSTAAWMFGQPSAQRPGQAAGRFEYDEAAIRALRYAAWEAGTVLGSAAAPYSLADVRLALERAELAFAGTAGSVEALSGLAALRELVRPQQPGFGQEAKKLEADIGAELAVEAYPRLWNDGELETPWSWSRRAALVRLPLSLSALGVLQARTVVELREDHNAVELNVVPTNWSNWIESGDYIDYAFPFESFVAFEYGPLSLSLGRDKLRWGPGITGTLVLSDRPDHYDYVDAALTGDWLAYRFAHIAIDPSVTAAERALLPETYVSKKSYILHRFEFLLAGRVALALTEGLMVGGMEQDLSLYNPFLVLHNLWAWNRSLTDGLGTNNMKSAASILGAELRFNPWRYMELYGAFAMNQLQTAYELSRFGDDAVGIPNAYAWQAGIDAAYPLYGGWIRASAEYVFTNPWMYLRENILNSFVWRRVLPTNVAAPGTTNLTSAPVGYAYGPDARVFFCALGWDSPARLSFSASVEYAERGEQSILSAYREGPEAVALTTPTGVAERTTSLGLELAWNPRAGISLYGAVLYRAVDNAAHVAGQKASAMDALVGISVSFR